VVYGTQLQATRRSWVGKTDSALQPPHGQSSDIAACYGKLCSADPCDTSPIRL